MSDYVIHAKLKNNNILRRILKHWKTVREFCREMEQNQSIVGSYINLKLPAILECGEWRASALKLADALGCLPDELFVEEQQTVRLKTNQAFIELSRQQAIGIATGMDAIERSIDLKRIIPLLLGKCTDREGRMLELRYLGEMTPDDAAKAFEVSRERARQIEMKALRRIRGFLANDESLRHESESLI